jgi:hypothetical protein
MYSVTQVCRAILALTSERRCKDLTLSNYESVAQRSGSLHYTRGGLAAIPGGRQCCVWLGPGGLLGRFRAPGGADRVGFRCDPGAPCAGLATADPRV